MVSSIMASSIVFLQTNRLVLKTNGPSFSIFVCLTLIHAKMFPEGRVLKEFILLI